MKAQVQGKAKTQPYKGSSYSALLCALALLLVGLLIKFGAAIQLLHVRN